MEPFKARDRLHGAERLERLKQVVLDPKLNPHNAFDFGMVVGTRLATDREAALDNLAAGQHKCGTVGCLIGTCPAAFPEHWKFEGDWAYPIIERDEDNDWSDFFGLSENESLAAFSPCLQDHADLPHLKASCTAEQACANLDILIKRMREEPTHV